MHWICQYTEQMSRIDFLNNIFKIIKNDFNNFKNNKKITLSLVED